jgi:hypothetical protein
VGVGIQLDRSHLHCIIIGLFVKASLFCGVRRVNGGSSLLASGDLEVAGLLVETWLFLKLRRHVLVSCSVDIQIPRQLPGVWLPLIAVLVHVQVIVLAELHELLRIDGGLNRSRALVMCQLRGWLRLYPLIYEVVDSHF